MKLAERHQRINDKKLDDICWKSKNLYNVVNYLVRQQFFADRTIPDEYTISTNLAYENNPDFRALPAWSSQQVIKQVFKNWKSYFAAHNSWIEHPERFEEEPKIPKYKKKDGKNIITLRVSSVKNGKIITEGKLIKPIKTKINDTKTIKNVRIVPQATCYHIEIVYEREEEKNENVNKKKILTIDPGVNNLATTSSNVGLQPFIINGRPLKSINQYYNKKKAKLQANLPKDVYTSKRIQRLTRKRNNKINDYLHKASNYIIQYCIKKGIGCIYFGHNDGWKQGGMNIVAKKQIKQQNNQNFISIPFNTFFSQLEYKGKLVGIEVKQKNESYTSKCDHFAFEEMKHHENYLGKRVKRGLFKSSTGKIYNADVNGAIGILRKVVSKSAFKQLVNRGFVLKPFKVNL